MSNPCDVSICDPSNCHDEVCFGEPSVGSIDEKVPCYYCIKLFCADRDGPDAHMCTEQQTH